MGRASGLAAVDVRRGPVHARPSAAGAVRPGVGPAAGRRLPRPEPGGYDPADPPGSAVEPANDPPANPAARSGRRWRTCSSRRSAGRRTCVLYAVLASVDLLFRRRAVPEKARRGCSGWRWWSRWPRRWCRGSPPGLRPSPPVGSGGYLGALVGGVPRRAVRAGRDAPDPRAGGPRRAGALPRRALRSGRSRRSSGAFRRGSRPAAGAERSRRPPETSLLLAQPSFAVVGTSPMAPRRSPRRASGGRPADAADGPACRGPASLRPHRQAGGILGAGPPAPPAGAVTSLAAARAARAAAAVPGPGARGQDPRPGHAPGADAARLRLPGPRRPDRHRAGDHPVRDRAGGGPARLADHQPGRRPGDRPGRAERPDRRADPGQDDRRHRGPQRAPGDGQARRGDRGRRRRGIDKLQDPALPGQGRQGDARWPSTWPTCPTC